jgi:hypothetical protein
MNDDCEIQCKNLDIIIIAFKDIVFLYFIPHDCNSLAVCVTDRFHHT